MMLLAKPSYNDTLFLNNVTLSHGSLLLMTHWLEGNPNASFNIESDFYFACFASGPQHPLQSQKATTLTRACFQKM